MGLLHTRLCTTAQPTAGLVGVSFPLQPTRWGRDVVSLGRLPCLTRSGRFLGRPPGLSPFMRPLANQFSHVIMVDTSVGYRAVKDANAQGPLLAHLGMYVLTERTWVSKCSCPSDQYKMGMPFAVNAARPRLLHSSPSLKLLTIPAIRCCWSQDAVRTSRGRPGRQCCPRCRWSSLPLYP